MKTMQTKKILAVGLALVLSMGFAGCSLPEEESSDKSNVFTVEHRLEEYIDSETGVHYIKPVTSGAGLTPRLNADGTVMVDK